MIKLNTVSKYYSQSSSVGPLTLDIPKTGLTSLIGPNGAGKSTMLLMIGRLLKLDAGTIHVAGMNVADTRSGDLARVLAILRQDNHFITRLTVRQLVAFGRFPYSGGRLTVVDYQAIARYIEFFNLESIADCYLDELSGGQRQRAYVAMILCQETDYILLDEPLNNLDIAHSVQMMDHLRQAVDSLGRTIVMVLHDLNFAARYSDYICAMQAGQIQHFGPPASIFRPEILSELYGTPVEVYESPRGLVVAV